MEFLVDILPFLVFVVLKHRMGLKEGVIGALIFAVIAVGYHLFNTGSLLNPTLLFVLVSVVLMAGLGYLALKNDKDTVFKFQPVIIGVIAGVVLIGGVVLFDYPILQALIEDIQQRLAADPAATQAVQMPKNLDYMAFSQNVGLGFLALSGLVAFAALKLSDWWWFSLRAFGFPIMMILALLNSM